MVRGGFKYIRARREAREAGRVTPRPRQRMRLELPLILKKNWGQKRGRLPILQAFSGFRDLARHAAREAGRKCDRDILHQILIILKKNQSDLWHPRPEEWTK